MQLGRISPVSSLAASGEMIVRLAGRNDRGNYRAYSCLTTVTTQKPMHVYGRKEEHRGVSTEIAFELQLRILSG